MEPIESSLRCWKHLDPSQQQRLSEIITTMLLEDSKDKETLLFLASIDDLNEWGGAVRSLSKDQIKTVLRVSRQIARLHEITMPVGGFLSTMRFVWGDIPDVAAYAYRMKSLYTRLAEHF